MDIFYPWAPVANPPWTLLWISGKVQQIVTLKWTLLGHTGLIDKLAQQSHTDIPFSINRDWKVNLTSLFCQWWLPSTGFSTHPAHMNAAICFVPPARGRLGIRYSGSIDIGTHAGRHGSDMDRIRCCLQPGFDATDNYLIDIFDCFLWAYRLRSCIPVDRCIPHHTARLHPVRWE